MKEIISVRLGHYILNIDSDANAALTQYLHLLQNKYANEEGGQEILSDIEERIGELLKQKQDKAGVNFSTLSDVEDVIQQIGIPEETESTSNPQAETNFQGNSGFKNSKKLYRDLDEKVVAGVSSGLGAYFNIDPVWIRILFVITTITGGFGIPVYITLWVVMPAAFTASDRLKMKGQNPNLKNIEEIVKNEINDAASSIKRQYKSGSMDTAAQGLANLFKTLGRIISTVIISIFIILGISLIIGYLTNQIVIENPVFGLYGKSGVDTFLNIIGADYLYKIGIIFILSLFVALLFLNFIPKENRNKQVKILKRSLWAFIVISSFSLIIFAVMKVSEIGINEEKNTITEVKPLLKDTLYIRIEEQYKNKNGLYSNIRIEDIEESSNKELRIEQFQTEINNNTTLNKTPQFKFENNELVLQQSVKVTSNKVSEFPVNYIRLHVPKNTTVLFTGDSRRGLFIGRHYGHRLSRTHWEYEMND